MRVDIIMPKMGMSMESGIVSEWLKNDGDAVTEGEIVANIETDKIVNTVSAPASGTLHIIAETDVDIPVAEVIAYVD